MSANMQERKKVFGDLMAARAELRASIAGVAPGTFDEWGGEYTYPLIGRVEIQRGSRISIERPYNGEGEEHGIYVTFVWASDPGYEDRNGRLIRFFIGTKSTGPLAQYEAHYDGDKGQWFELSNQRQFGKKYACGGTWSATKVASPPAIFTKLAEIMEQQIAQQKRIAQAKARLEAAKLMVIAHEQRNLAASYSRQGLSPIYAGQETVCADKANTAVSLAAATEARAQLILAQAGV